MNLPVITNALQNIKNSCQNKLNRLYPKGIPGDMETRYKNELSFLEHSEFINDFEVFRRLSEEAKKSSNIINSRGTLSGSLQPITQPGLKFKFLQPRGKNNCTLFHM